MLMKDDLKMLLFCNKVWPSNSTSVNTTAFFKNETSNDTNFYVLKNNEFLKKQMIKDFDTPFVAHLLKEFNFTDLFNKRHACNFK